MAGLIADPDAKRLAMAMTDRVIRSQEPHRAAEGWRSLLSRFGLPVGFPLRDRLALLASQAGSWLLPEVVMSAVRRQLQEESRDVILSAEPEALTRYLKRRHERGLRVNLNQLGEAVLGEEEAARRVEAVLALLARPDVNYVSVKLSALFSQIHLPAWEATLETVKARLRQLYRAARPGGKFVNLDMEEYRDLALTVAAFREVLEEPEFLSLSAGIVLQAYLPDSWNLQRELTSWAQARVTSGGAPIKIRLVKGANLAMEIVEAELHGWTPAPYATKAETDANYRRMLEFACQPEHAAAVRVGVASHNLFDLALALVLREHYGSTAQVELEMLEGMANHQARAAGALAGGVLLYAPVVAEKDFGSALAYLIRRLDENTAPGNFLSDMFALRPGSPAWERQQAAFLNGWKNRHRVSTQSRRATLSTAPESDFHNAVDTDWTQPSARAALAAATTDCLPELPAPVDMAGVNTVLDTARRAQPQWEARGETARAALLRQAAALIEQRRFATIALLREEGKKAITDADGEVSEAIDFLNYYAATGAPPAGTEARALGVVTVTPPWNFPFAIPCGGVAAALMAGNAVVLKPAPETQRLGWWLACMLWEAGVPREALHFVACEDGAASRALITDPRTDAVVLTGGYETARLFQSWRPSLPLFAETSGKNSLIISALADRDLAIKDLVRSAFGHAGQKCSAASLAILEAEVYDDPTFRRQLRDAAASLHVGPASDPVSVVTPLIREPNEALRRALTQLDEGESWLLEPRLCHEDPCLWSPGIKLGVRPGSWFHHTECFGPVLGLMRARDLREALALQNAVSYGLTAGLHSLDEGEIAFWKDHAQAGNLYVNRPITGAIVRRQPFGGWKRSSIGPGAKAGGPHYVNLFRHLADATPADVAAAQASYREAWETYFSQEHDPSGLACERNVLRFRPCRGVVLRLEKRDARQEALARAAAEVTGVPLHVSYAEEESELALAARLPQLARQAEFFRTVIPPGDDLLGAVHTAELNWINAPLSGLGRVELTRWVREQSVSETRHRYGNLLAPR